MWRSSLDFDCDCAVLWTALHVTIELQHKYRYAACSDGNMRRLTSHALYCTHFPGLVFSRAVQARYRLKKTAMAFMLENQMPLTSLEPSRQKLVLSVIEEYHGPIVSVSLCPLSRLVQLLYCSLNVSRN